jgi:hypothetical protein
MKKIILTIVFTLIPTNALANCPSGICAVEVNATTGVVTYTDAPRPPQPQGAWVKVDASGNATGQAIVCSSDVCGNNNSPYAKATLSAGEQYVLQAVADPITNNVAGIGNNNPNTQVQVNIPTQEWTITRTNTVIPELPLIINNQEVTSYTYKTIDKFTADKAPWVFLPTPVIDVVESATSTATILEASIKAKPAKAKKTKVKAKKKAAIK